MADAIVRANVEGTWRPLAPVWSLGIEGDQHGPAQATFVCKRRLPKFTEIEIAVGGLVVGDGWVEDCETEGGLSNVTVWCWQRHLDDDLYTRTYMMSGFADAIDARSAPGISLGYWARAGVNISERSLTLGMQPNTIWYAEQAGGVTYDLGEGGVGPRKVWLRRQYLYFPSKTSIKLYVRAHSTRANHHPASAGNYIDSAEAPPVMAGTSGDPYWYGFTFAANAFRYLSVFLHTTATYDLAKDASESFITFNEARTSTLEGDPNHPAPVVRDNSGITSDRAIPHIVSMAPKLTLGSNPTSTIPLYGLDTDGYQTPRQMLDRVNVDQWRYRVNPGRRLDRGAYPTVPAYTIANRDPARLRIPDTHDRVIVQYRDLQGDERQLVRSVASPRQRSQVISLGANAAEEQAISVADAFLKDQSERRIEGTARVAPGALSERPSGQPLHPSRLLLAGGDRAYLDEAGDHGRIVRVSYDHQTESAEVEFSEPQDDLDRQLAYLETRPT